MDARVDSTGFFTPSGSNIQLLADIPDLDFFDSQSVALSRPISPLEAWGMIMARPSPVLKLAFRIRDGVSSMFGVKKIGGFTTACPKTISVGEKLDFFLVEHSSADILSLSERDRHLDVLTCISTQGNQLTISSSVQTHNLFGRLYMIPVGPAHKMIVRAFLHRIKTNV